MLSYGCLALALHIAECAPPPPADHAKCRGDLELEWPRSQPAGQEQDCAKGREKRESRHYALKVRVQMAIE